jgi:predicted transcriptional regulator
MATTTIKVDSAVRDRLAVLARERGTTMGAMLAEVTERLEREAFFAKAREQLHRLRQDDPSAWEADRLESASWRSGTDRDTLSSRDDAGWWE